ncbi:hypothetical protein TWF696_009534 [Orbilia brochopaga]|uniref:Uncharacterized protein n=1 Tax=Orbilia brochopaga TaxID=3140254 RepID=A0AAV9UF91_9PEZI
MASIAKSLPPPAAADEAITTSLNNINNNNNNNTTPLTSTTTAASATASSPSTAPANVGNGDGPRSMGQQEIGLISRIHEEENTYTANGTLFPGDDYDDYDDDWNADANAAGYKLQAANGSSTTAADLLSMNFDAAATSSYTFDGPAANTNNMTVDEAITPTPWDSQHPLAALFNPPDPDPIQRSFTAPATSFPLTLQERRLQLRNSHIRATPMASSVKPEDVHIKGLSRAANALRTKHFQSLGRASTVSSRLSDLTASDDDMASTARKASSNFGSLPSIHASLRHHRKTPSVEQSGYIDHLEKQISDLSVKLRSYTDPTSEKSHAAIVQRLNAKVRSLENQVTEWEALFDERIRETERINSRERSSYTSQIKLLRDQIDALNHTVAGLEEDLDMERKQNAALTLAVTEKKALAMDNAQLAQALTKALGEIAELEAVVQEREEMIYNTAQQGTLGSLMIDVTPKPRSLETFSEMNLNLGVNTPTMPTAATATAYSPTDAAWQTLSPTTSNASTADMPLKRKMRKFPSGMAGPQQLILSPTHSRRSSGDFLTRGHSRGVSSSRGGSPSLEKMAGRHNSLFAELEKLQEDGIVTTINDETLSNISQAPHAEEASDGEQQQHIQQPQQQQQREEYQQRTPQGHSTSPTDTETSDSEGAPKSEHTSPGSRSASSSSSPASSSRLGSGISYVLYSPIRVTSAVIRGVLSPRSTLRNMRQRAMEQLVEVSEIEDSFASDILFGDQYDEHLRTGGQRLVPPSPTPGSVRSRRRSSNGVKDIQIVDNTGESSAVQRGTAHRRGARRGGSRDPLLPITSDEDDVVVFAGRSGDPNTPCRVRRKTAGKEGKPILPVKPRPDVRERVQQRRRPGSASTSSPNFNRLPPPYSEYPETVKKAASGTRTDDGWRTEDSMGEINDSGGEREKSAGVGTELWIPESQVRAMRGELDRARFLRGAGENGVVLWTKLFMGLFVTMFVALRDGPSVALERVDVKRGVKSAASTPVRRREIKMPRTG